MHTVKAYTVIDEFSGKGNMKLEFSEPLDYCKLWGHA